MKKPKDAKTRKEAQRKRQAALGIKRVEVALSTREREQLETLRRARAGSGEPYSADEYFSTLLRRDWERWQEQEASSSSRSARTATVRYRKGVEEPSRVRRTAGVPAGTKRWHCDRSHKADTDSNEPDDQL
ncbi:hypothetical protein [Aeromonas dhakensis]|uniref:hypothetical protein n=1 Tax=Aeromonas dhakensis TaxID=196024 RepID=UPI001F2D0014|nr:hypothetical protein [Aeromonas dhakensis]